ncbi:MAG: hypothetical protein PUI41_12425 [Lachnospiraceae bacterium]|nr:hypothetical protein [Lachnospiraceae bacterium]MDD7051703.1 hypothetical protein [Lachnospiraceae bacterium]MDY4097025.1 hypothetical protein [Lachnospiraceae bacterium]
MDNFIDKLAQKFTAGEVIRANQAAEEQELRRLRQQVAEYENCLQEMRKLQLLNTETAESMKQLQACNTEAAESMRQLQACNTETAESLKQLLEKSYADLDRLTRESLDKITQLTVVNQDKGREEELDRLLKTLEANQKEIADWFKRADDFLHKENVKVYRNVQAVVVEENKAKTEAILAAQEATARKYYVKTKWLLLLTFLAAVTGVSIQILSLCGIF